MSDSAPATHACCIAPSRLISSEDRLFSWVQIGYTASSSLESRSVNRLGNGGRRRSAKSVHLRCVWWLDEFCVVETLHARFYIFEKVAALERATCLEPDGIVFRLSAD